MSKKEDLQVLIAKHNRRLQKLKEQQASFGLHAPPHISIEIEDIEAKIQGLERELANILEPIEENTSTSTQEQVPGLSPSLLKRLHKTLINCGWFSDNARLKTLFVDQRIAAWRDGVPEVDSTKARVAAIVSYLHSSYNHTNDNALILFLCVLADNIAPSDALHREILDLAIELEKVLVK